MAAVKKKAAAAPPKPTPAQVLLNPPLRGAAPAAPRTAPVVAAKPVAAPVKPKPKPTVPAKPVMGGQGRTAPQVNIPQAQAEGWGQTQSPRLLEQAGANMAQEEWGTDTTTEAGTNALLDAIMGGGSGSSGPTTAQKRAGGLEAARILAGAGRRGFNMYGDMADQLGQQLEALYDPYYSQQEQGINTQRQAALDFLNNQYGGNRQAIETATAAALAAIPTSAAYQNVPIVNLQQEQNPLMNALAAYGASGQAATQQSAADAQMAQQLSDLVKGSAGQMSAAQQAVMDAAKFDVTAGGTNALQQLALAKQAGEYGIGSESQRALSELARERLGAQGDIISARAGFQGKGIDAFLSGLTDSATQRAKTIAEYGPAPKKQKTETGKNLPKGGKQGKNVKGGNKPRAVAPKPSKPSKSSKPSKPSKPSAPVKKAGVKRV